MTIPLSGSGPRCSPNLITRLFLIFFTARRSRRMTGRGHGLRARIDPAAETSYFKYYWSTNPFVPTGKTPTAPWPLNVRTDEDDFRREDFIRTEYYNDFLKPQDIGSALIARLGRHNGTQTD